MQFISFDFKLAIYERYHRQYNRSPYCTYCQSLPTEALEPRPDELSSPLGTPLAGAGESGRIAKKEFASAHSEGGSRAASEKSRETTGSSDGSGVSAAAGGGVAWASCGADASGVACSRR